MYPDLVHISQHWSTPDKLLEALIGRGFRARFFSETAKAQIEAQWDKLCLPASAASSPDLRKYCYIHSPVKGFSSTEWGLIFSDEKALSHKGLISEAAPVIVTDYSDAAMDFVLVSCFPSEWTGASAVLPQHVQAEAGVLVGPHCEFDEGVILESGVRLGANVKIGAHTRVGANTSIRDNCVIGKHCQIKSHASIGGTGFGHVLYPKTPRPTLRRHIGRVVIGDYVTLGSFVGVDRGVFEDTKIGEGTAVDNLVQIAHNCELGRNNILCSFVGLSGSIKLGDQVTLAGMVGVKDHVHIGNNVTVTAMSGVSGNLEPNQVLKGYPPRPLNDALRIEVLTGKLPEMYKRLKDLEKKLDS